MNTKPPPRKERTCPICGRPTHARYRPFCSSHCANVDLGRWVGGHYRIPTSEGPADGDDRGGHGTDDA